MEIEKILNYRFNKYATLEQALTHGSFFNESGIHSSNQRLEFLGDSILGFVLTVYLMDRFPKAQEGELTKRRAQFACEKSLAAIARKLDLSTYIRKERKAFLSDSIMADTLEAIIGAIYQDGGLKEAEQFVFRIFDQALANGTVDYADVVDHKSNLQKMVHATFGGTEPSYEIKELTKDKEFQCDIWVMGFKLGTGIGGSKKKAQFAAAERACEFLKNKKIRVDENKQVRT